MVPHRLAPPLRSLPGLSGQVSVAFLAGLPRWLGLLLGWALAPAWWIYLMTAAADRGLAASGTLGQGAVLVLRPARRRGSRRVRVLLAGVAATLLASLPALLIATAGLVLEVAGQPDAGTAVSVGLGLWGLAALGTVAVLAAPQLRTPARTPAAAGITVTVLAAWPAGHGHARALWQQFAPHLATLQQPVIVRPRTAALAATYRRHGFSDSSDAPGLLTWIAPITSRVQTDVADGQTARTRGD